MRPKGALIVQDQASKCQSGREATGVGGDQESVGNKESHL